jgi:dTDP-4-dehydrorhamnose 3,5-epimerase
MIFRELDLPDAFLLEPERLPDERGFFARTFCRREFEAHGLETEVVQCSLSFNRRRGTVRGMHWQAAPAEEAKLVRAVRGAVHDVIVDVRPGSPTEGRHAAVRLDADNRLALYVPPGFAHGFQTLEDGTELLYQMSAFHAPEHARGFRHDDPEVCIRWPLPVSVISERDRGLPSLAELHAREERP